MEQTFSEKKIFDAKCYLCGNHYSTISQYDKLDFICENINCSFFKLSKNYPYRPTFSFIEKNKKFNSCGYFIPFKLNQNWYLISGKEKFIMVKDQFIKIIDYSSLEIFDKNFTPNGLSIHKNFIPLNITNIEEGINFIKNKLTNYLAYV